MVVDKPESVRAVGPQLHSRSLETINGHKAGREAAGAGAEHLGEVHLKCQVNRLGIRSTQVDHVGCSILHTPTKRANPPDTGNGQFEGTMFLSIPCGLPTPYVLNGGTPMGGKKWADGEGCHCLKKLSDFQHHLP
jgi:hypothetical protein